MMVSRKQDMVATGIIISLKRNKQKLKLAKSVKLGKCQLEVKSPLLRLAVTFIHTYMTQHKQYS